MKKKFFLHALVFLMIVLCASMAFATDFTELTGTWKVISVDNPGNETIPSVGDTVKVKVIQFGTFYTVTSDIETKNYTVQNGKLVSEVIDSPGILDRDEVTYTAPNNLTFTCRVGGVLNFTTTLERVSSTVDENGHETVPTQTDFSGLIGTWKAKVVASDAAVGMTPVTVGLEGELKITQSGDSYVFTWEDGDVEVFEVKGDTLVREYSKLNDGGVFASHREELTYDSLSRTVTYNEYVDRSGGNNLIWKEKIVYELVSFSEEDSEGTNKFNVITYYKIFTNMTGTWKVVSTDRCSYNEDGTLKSQKELDAPKVGETCEIKVTKSGTSYDVTISGDTKTYGVSHDIFVSNDILVREYYASGKLMGEEELIFTDINNVTHNEYEYDGRGNVSWKEVIKFERVLASTKSETPSSEVIESINKAVTTIVSEIVKIFSNLPTNVRNEIKTFSDTNSTTKTSEITNEELASVISSDSEKSLVVLETRTVNEKGIYMFKVPSSSLTGLATGTKIFIHMIVSGNVTTPSVTLGAVKVAVTDSESAVFVDDNGNVIKTIPSSGNVNVAAYMEANTAYTPVVTKVADTTDTTNPTTDTENKNNGNDISPSGAGCDLSGLGIFGFLIFATALKFKK